MSHSFYIENVGSASLKDTLAALPYEDLVVDTDVADQGWPAIAHVYQDKVSVRAIETAMEDAQNLDLLTFYSVRHNVG